MEELNHEFDTKNHFKIAHDYDQDKKTSLIGSMTNKLDNFFASKNSWTLEIQQSSVWTVISKFYHVIKWLFWSSLKNPFKKFFELDQNIISLDRNYNLTTWILVDQNVLFSESLQSFLYIPKWIKIWQPSVPELKVMMNSQDHDEIINTCSEPLMGDVPKMKNRDRSSTDFYQWQST